MRANWELFSFQALKINPRETNQIRFSGPGGLGLFRSAPAELVGGNIIEDERDAVLGALVRHTVLHLVIDFVGFAHLELVRAAVDHESDTRVGRDRHMDAVARME